MAAAKKIKNIPSNSGERTRRARGFRFDDEADFDFLRGVVLFRAMGKIITYSDTFPYELEPYPWASRMVLSVRP